MALPLLAAGGAQAADATTWDRVALCESGGSWTANSGNGFYGGLQLTLEMWKDYGGESYAERPDLASRAQQIAVAESVLNDRGPDAWPSCAVHAGLDVDGLIPDVDPGGTETPEPQPTEPGGDASGSPSAGTDADGGDTQQPSGDTSTEPSGGPTAPDATPSAGGTDSRPSGDATGDAHTGTGGKAGSDDGKTGDGKAGDSVDRPADEPSGDAATPSGEPSAPGTGRHRGDSGDAKGGDRGDGKPAGRHASRGGDAHRGTPVVDGMYTVRPGDSLSAIAEAQGLAEGWTGLYDANESVIGADPDLIHPGQRLDLGQ
ncbi:transglycosylase family protein [Streptomyces sp. Ru73]|uniref:transglycosylase family protein n=1 Tax=Streptomyces sp. Ru73 TaxID=2080748 RepID=UPI0027E51C07|nr:transglycosylase family protein [Streptomyces sp. Ru73]